MHYPAPDENFHAKYPIGVIIGRFQLPKLHEAHKVLVETVKERHDQVVIVLGVAPTMGSKRNPLDFDTRRSMIQQEYPGLIVIALPDQRDDVAWSRELERRLKEVVGGRKALLYGGRESFIPHYKGCFDTAELKQDVYISATMVRDQAARRVIEDESFRAGVVYGTTHRYDAGIPTVDIVPFRRVEDGIEILLAGKPGEADLRMIGGFVDPSKDVSKRQAALRELHEEVGINFSVAPETIRWVTEGRVDDWRYRNEGDKIFTDVFVVEYQYGTPVPADDIERVEWVKMTFRDPVNVVPEHFEFIAAVRNFLFELSKNG